MTEQNMMHVDDIIAECQEALTVAVNLAHHMMALKQKGVTHVDNNMDPVIPDNVLMFPANRSIQ